MWGHDTVIRVLITIRVPQFIDLFVWGYHRHIFLHLCCKTKEAEASVIHKTTDERLREIR